MGTNRLTPLERVEFLGEWAIYFLEKTECTEAQAEACAKIYLNIVETQLRSQEAEESFKSIVIDERNFENLGNKVVVPNFKKSSKQFGKKMPYAKKRMANRSA